MRRERSRKKRCNDSWVRVRKTSWRPCAGSASEFVIVVRPHDALILAEYQKLLTAAMVKLHSAWKKRVPPPGGA